MKKITPILIIILIAGLSWLVYTLSITEKSSLSDEALSDFAIKDTASIDRIKISSNVGGQVDFFRVNGHWEFKEGGCLQQHMLDVMLETIKYVAVKAPVPVGAVDNVTKRILGQHKKIEIYQSGKLTKTWFIGGTTADHYGTYMLLKIEGKGTSPEPFITYMPSVYGNLSDLFSLRIKDYECSGIFLYDPLDIKEVDVQIPDSAHLNYTIKSLDSNKFELYQNEMKVNNFDTTQIRKYLLGFRKIHYEIKNPIVPQEVKDSTLANTPTYIIKVTDKKGNVNKVTTYLKFPIFNNYDYDGNLITHDLNSLFAVTNSGTFVQVQYFVFDKLFRDINFFKIN